MVSSVWKYFTKCGINEAVCSLCTKQLKTGGGTTNLRTHLKTKHHNIFFDEKSVITKIESIEAPECIIELQPLHALQLQPTQSMQPTQFAIGNGGSESEKDSLGYKALEQDVDLPSVAAANPACSIKQEIIKRRKRKPTESFVMNGSPIGASLSDKLLNRSGGEDKFDVAGKMIAYKMRELPPDVALVAEKFISDILYEAALGNISKHSRINIFDTDSSVVLPMS